MGTPTNPLLDQIRLQARQQAQQPDTPPPALLPPPGAEGPAPMIQTPQPNVQAPRGTLQGEQAERNRLVKSGPGANQVYGDITNSSFGQNHPLAGKLVGGAAQGLASLGNIALSAVSPRLASLVPGTSGHHAALLGQENKNINQMQGEQQKTAQTGLENAQTAQDQAATSAVPSEIALRGGQTREANARANALENPQPPPKEEHWTVTPEFTGPNGEPVEVEQNSGQLRIAGDTGAKRVTKDTKESTPQQQTYDDLIKQGYTPMEAYEKIREKPAGEGATGTWTLDEDKGGNPILFNSKTGATRAAPAGIAKSGTFAKAEAANKKETEPIDSAQGYAADYLSNGRFTGPGDEALQEKFFELAKPSTGFRMTQPQISMLQNSRTWMGSLEAHLRHATTGTWFSDDQRKQIVDTMNQLAEEKRKAATSNPAGNGEGGGPKEGDTKQNSAGDKLTFKGGKWQLQQSK